jgi:DNA-binding transcriptional LysR family regulator
MLFDTRISLYKLEVLCAVVERGGFSRAAEQLWVTQPVVTAHIRSLESRLGVCLFERSGRGVVPTEVGDTVYAWAKEMLTRSDDMVRQVAGLAEGSSGNVNLVAGMTTGTYILPSILIDFQHTHPDAAVTVTQLTREAAILAVIEGGADLALVLAEDDAVLPDTVTSEWLADERLVLVASPDSDYPTSVPATTLSAYPFVCSPVGGLQRTLVDGRLRSMGIEDRDVVICLDHPEAIKQAVLADLGVALLLRSTVQEDLDSGRLREIELPDADPTVPVHVVHRKEKRFTPLQQSVLDHVRAALAPLQSFVPAETVRAPVARRRQGTRAGAMAVVSGRARTKQPQGGAR